VSGSYRWNRYTRTTIEKALNPIGLLQFHVMAMDDGTLTVRSVVPFLKPARYTEVEPLLFERLDGASYIAFREDEDGRITHMFGAIGSEPATFEKVAWYETDRLQLGLIAFLLLAFLSVLAWPVLYVIHRVRRRRAQDPRPARLARLVAALLSALNLFFIAGLAAVLTQGLAGAASYSVAYGKSLALLVIPILTTALSLVLLVFAALAWKDRYWSLVGRLHYTVVTLAALVFVWFANYWNLLGFKL
jgi:hypothetical protein